MAGEASGFASDAIAGRARGVLQRAVVAAIASLLLLSVSCSACRFESSAAAEKTMWPDAVKHRAHPMLASPTPSRDTQMLRPPPEREDEAPVRVVVRSRPLNAIEKSDGCRFVHDIHDFLAH